jgi:hypothetical protein
MIELAFSESSAGTLKMAKSLNHGERLKGSSKDVEALTLALDIGDISDLDPNKNARKKLLDDLFADFPGVPEEIWETNQHTLTRLQEAKARLEPVRLWACKSDPAELCGLYFVCRLMVDTQTSLSVVYVPEQIEIDNSIISYRNSGAMSPEAFGMFIDYEEPISELQRRACANIWSDLVRENAPLRAVINGSLTGVPKNFYDFALRANMPVGKFKVRQLIGKTLSQISGVSDRWLYLRIQVMLQSGELIMVAAAAVDQPCSEVVKRSNGTVM